MSDIRYAIQVDDDSHFISLKINDSKCYGYDICTDLNSQSYDWFDRLSIAKIALNLLKEYDPDINAKIFAMDLINKQVYEVSEK